MKEFIDKYLSKLLIQWKSMSTDAKYLLVIGSSLIIITYIVFYTPASNYFFGIKKPTTIPTIPNMVFSNVKPNVSMPTTETSAQSGEVSAKKISLRNPFSVGFVFEKAPEVSSGEVVAPPSLFVLQGIFVLPQGKNSALIDDKMLTEGQAIYGWQLVRIYSDRVVLTKGNLRKVLRLKLGVE